MFPEYIPFELCNLILEFADEEKETLGGFAITEAIQGQHPVHLDNYTNYPNFSINKVLAAWGYGPNDFELILSIHDSVLLASRSSQEFAGKCEFVFTRQALLEPIGLRLNREVVYCIGDIAEVVCLACNASFAYGFIFDYILYDYYFPNGVMSLIDYDMFLCQQEMWKRRPEFMRSMCRLNVAHTRRNWIRFDTHEQLSWNDWVLWRKTM